MRTLITRLSLLLISYSAFGQKINSVEVKLEGSMVQVNYRMDGFRPGQDYEVYLYSAHNNYALPLQFVKGDVGQNVKGDANVKKITWDARSELGVYQDKISLELRGKQFVPFLKISTPLAGQNFKKGKNYMIEWDGADQINQLDFQLIREDKVQSTVKNIPNRQNYNWIVQKDIKPGKDYKIKISNPTNSLEYVMSDAFAIKSKIPVFVYFTPLLLGGAYFLIPSGEENPPPGQQGSGIPDPPLPE
jgi:hypothetical protein